jgi:acetylornithine deacetylase
VLRIRPIWMHVVDGFDTVILPFTTDVPWLDRWGAPLLFGPGSFLVAHTDDEHVALDELEAAARAYVRLARACLDGNGPRPADAAQAARVPGWR